MYQILLMKHSKQFMGKMNITFGEVKNTRAMFIDALEFNPQACENGPYRQRAELAFMRALTFTKELALKEQVHLFALVRSNSSDANAILRKEGTLFPETMLNKGAKKSKKGKRSKEGTFSVYFTLPKETVQLINQNKGRVWYQVFDQEVIPEDAPVTLGEEQGEGVRFQSAEQRKNLIDERLDELERDVINPAQIVHGHIAQAMQQRDFEHAAKLILEDKEYAAKVGAFFGGYSNISPKLLARKIGLLYKSQGESASRVTAGMTLHSGNFVQLV